MITQIVQLRQNEEMIQIKLKDYSISELLEELKKRNGVAVEKLGIYQGYTMKGKYGNPDIEDGTAIIIQSDP